VDELNRGAPQEEQSTFSDDALVAFCGINCKDCKSRSQRRMHLARSFKASLQELPIDLFKEILPPFKNIDEVMAFLDFLPQLSVMQTCCSCAEKPCGSPDCEIRACAKSKRYRTCAECGNYEDCSKLDFLKPHHTTLISDLDLIKDRGFDQYVTEVVAKYKLEPLS